MCSHRILLHSTQEEKEQLKCHTWKNLVHAHLHIRRIAYELVEVKATNETIYCTVGIIDMIR